MYHYQSTKYNFREYLLLFTLGVSTLIIGSGLYEIDAMPKDEYLVSILAIFLIIMCYLNEKNSGFIERNLLVGFIIFNAFILIRLLFSDQINVESKFYFTHIITLGLFISFFSATKLVLNNSTFSRQYIEHLISLLSILTLLTLLAGQMILVTTSSHHTFLSRPGGFLNANSTATLALIYLFVIIKIALDKNNLLFLLGLIISSVIILITQSRAVILILIPFWIYVLYNYRASKSIVVITILIALLFVALIASQSDFAIIPESIVDRFHGDQHSDARANIALTGFNDFLKAPFWGHSYKYLEATYGLGSHNQFIEILASYGLVGLFIIGIACYYLYVPFSALFFLFCIMPTLIFSHNFFDSYHFSAILGFALAIDRHYRKSTLSN